MNQVADEALALFAGSALKASPSNAILNLAFRLFSPITKPFAVRWPTLSTMPPRPCRGVCSACLSVHSSLAEDGAAVEIEVSDTGHGLTEEIRERLFLPFYSTKHRGTGLGLSIAAKIIQELGGSIRAESNTPKGARFLIRLPLLDQPIRLRTETNGRRNSTHRGSLMNHVLVVDDEAEIRASLEEILTEEGYGVATAATAAEALVAH